MLLTRLEIKTPLHLGWGHEDRPDEEGFSVVRSKKDKRNKRVVVFSRPKTRSQNYVAVPTLFPSLSAQKPGRATRNEKKNNGIS